MKVTVEMTEQEFLEFIKFQECKKTDQSSLNSLRFGMDNISDAILNAVDYDGDRKEEYKIISSKNLIKAIELAIDWYS